MYQTFSQTNMSFHRICLHNPTFNICDRENLHEICMTLLSHILHDTSIPCISAWRSEDLTHRVGLLYIKGSGKTTVGPLLTEGVCNAAYRRSFVCSRLCEGVGKDGEWVCIRCGLSNYNALSAQLAASSVNNCSRWATSAIMENERNYTWNRLWGPMYLRLTRSRPMSCTRGTWSPLINRCRTHAVQVITELSDQTF